MLGSTLQQGVFNDELFQGTGVLGQVGDADTNVQEAVLQRDRFKIGELSKAVRKNDEIDVRFGIDR